MAKIEIFMNSMLCIYAATAGNIMSNMLRNCMKVYISIVKPIYSVLQTEVHSNLLPQLCLQNRFGQFVIFPVSASFGCYLH